MDKKFDNTLIYDKHGYMLTYDKTLIEKRGLDKLADEIKDGAVSMAKKAGSKSLDAFEGQDDSGYVKVARQSADYTKKGVKGTKEIIKSPYRAGKTISRYKKTYQGFKKYGFKGGMQNAKMLKKQRQAQKLSRKASSLARRGAIRANKTAIKGGKAAAKAGSTAAKGAAKGTAAAAKSVGTAIAASGPIGIGVIAGVVVVLLLILFASALGGVQDNKGVGALTGVEAEIAQKLMDLGYSQVQTSAIMGNIYAESGYNSARCEGTRPDRDNLSASEIAGYWGYGLCQWTDSKRKPGMCNFCQSKGKSHSDKDCQLEYMHMEASTGTSWTLRGAYGFPVCSYQEWMQKTDITELTQIWMACFEGPSEEPAWNHLDKRIAEANRVYTAMQQGGEDGGGDIVSRARACIGKPYVWGAVGPDGYDCSGLVSYCVSGQHVRLGNTNTFMGWQVSHNLTPGDILVTLDHCAVYIGNGRVIHAPQPGQNVCETTMAAAFNGAQPHIVMAPGHEHS